jgi:hypothetical protein
MSSSGLDSTAITSADLADAIVPTSSERQQMTEVPFPQHHDMVEALASDRADGVLFLHLLPTSRLPYAGTGVFAPY